MTPTLRHAICRVCGNTTGELFDVNAAPLSSTCFSCQNLPEAPVRYDDEDYEHEDEARPGCRDCGSVTGFRFSQTRIGPVINGDLDEYNVWVDTDDYDEASVTITCDNCGSNNVPWDYA